MFVVTAASFSLIASIQAGDEDKANVAVDKSTITSAQSFVKSQNSPDNSRQADGSKASAPATSAAQSLAALKQCNCSIKDTGDAMCFFDGVVCPATGGRCTCAR